MLKKGFTLAEVLLTLTIIGVVAAITLPALMTNVGDSVLEAQVKKFYSVMTDGLELYKARTEQDNLIPGFNLDDELQGQIRFTDQILNASPCNSINECFADAYAKYDRTPYDTAENIIPEGEFVGRFRDGSVFSIFRLGNDTRWQVIADVNGRRGPNRVGEDMFNMYIGADGRIEINHIHPADCRDVDAQGSCIGIFVSNNFRFRNYREYVESGDDIPEGNNNGLIQFEDNVRLNPNEFIEMSFQR